MPSLDVEGHASTDQSAPSRLFQKRNAIPLPPSQTPDGQGAEHAIERDCEELHAIESTVEGGTMSGMR